MSTCVYCRNSITGALSFVKRWHGPCRTKKLAGEEKLSKRALATLTAGGQLVDYLNFRSDVSSDSFLTVDDVRRLEISAWQKAAAAALDDKVLTEDEETRLVAFMKEFDLTQDELDGKNIFTKLAQGSVLREVMHGNVPDIIKTDQPLPFNLQKGEKVVWVFPNVELLQDRNSRSYVGGYSGVSVRVAKGLYFRSGEFRGRPVDKTITVSLGTGPLALTQKHIYHGGPRPFRIPYSKVVSFFPFSNGFGVMKDSENAKPITFITGDGGFSFNLVSNLATLWKTDTEDDEIGELTPRI